MCAEVAISDCRRVRTETVDSVLESVMFASSAAVRQETRNWPVLLLLGVFFTLYQLDITCKHVIFSQSFAYTVLSPRVMEDRLKLNAAVPFM